MAQTMTPSERATTAGQIDKAVGLYRAMLEKHAPEFDSTAVQTVLGQTELASEQFGVFRKRIQAISDMIIHHVKVNRTRTPQAVLQATGRKQYVTEKVVESMPRGEGEEADIYFFKLGRYISDADLDKEYELRGLKPADPYSLAAVNEEDPAFADENPNSTHWKDADGNWCYAAFRRWYGERVVSVNHPYEEWDGGGWFAGLRK